MVHTTAVHTINPACSKLTFRPLHHVSHHHFTIFHHHKAHHYPLLRKALGDALRTLEQQRPKMPGPAIPTCLAERSYDAQAQQLAQLQQGIQAGDVPSGSLPGILPDIYILNAYSHSICHIWNFLGIRLICPTCFLACRVTFWHFI